MEDLKEKFTRVETVSGFSYVSGSGTASGFGYVSGSGSGSGYGSVSGSVYGFDSGSDFAFAFGFGDGSGDGSGFGSGDGSGFGSGDGIKAFAGQTVYMIDNVQTLIDHVHGNVAKGRILKGDLTTKKCYIVKQGGTFAHGASLREAQQALVDKLFDDMPEEERIEAFVAEHEIDTAYPNREFYSWHHRLTGSCDLGRRTWVEERGLSLDDSITTREFLELTKDAYGGAVIRKVMDRYGGQNG